MRRTTKYGAVGVALASATATGVYFFGGGNGSNEGAQVESRPQPTGTASAPQMTPATKRFDTLSAFVMGYTSKQNAAPEDNEASSISKSTEGRITVGITKNLGETAIGSMRHGVYEFSATGIPKKNGEAGFSSVTSFTVRSVLRYEGGEQPMFVLEANEQGKGWSITSKQGTEDGSYTSITGNSQNDLTDSQAEALVNQTLCVAADAENNNPLRIIPPDCGVK